MQNSEEQPKVEGVELEGAVTTETTETSNEETEEVGTEEQAQAGEQEASDENDDSKKDLPVGAQKRINKLTKKNKELASSLAEKDREIQYYQNLLNDNEDKSHLTEVERARHYAKQALAEEQVNRLESEKQQMRANVVAEAWNERVQEFESSVPDFRETMASAQVQVSNDVVEFLQESDAGVQIAYYLAKNQDEAEGLAYLSPKARERALIRLEMKMESQFNSKPNVKPSVSKAPAPTPNPTKQTQGSSPKKLEDLDGDDYLAQYRKQKYGV